MDYKIIKGCSKISVVGNRIRGVPGIMAAILKILRSNNIKVLQTADSHTTIWCLVKQEDSKAAVNILHNAFIDNFESIINDKKIC